MVRSPFFGVLCNSSTDGAFRDEEVIAVQYLENGTLKFDFLEFQPLIRASAGCILQTVCDCLGEHCPTWKNSLVALGADGAPVNLGLQCRGGNVAEVQCTPHCANS